MTYGDQHAFNVAIAAAVRHLIEAQRLGMSPYVFDGRPHVWHADVELAKAEAVLDPKRGVTAPPADDPHAEARWANDGGFVPDEP